MDFSKAGLLDGLKKTLIIALWIAVSGAVTALIAWVSSISINSADVYAVLGVGAVNAILAGISKWLTTHAPQK